VNHRLPGQHYRRFTVHQLVEGDYTDARGRSCPEKVSFTLLVLLLHTNTSQTMVAKEDRTGSHASITLRGSWANTTIAKDHLIHVSHLPGQIKGDDFFTSQQLELNDGEASPFLVVHPDHMLSATTVADSFDCTRKAVLQDRIKATGESSKAMIYGKILHEIFQQALGANKWDNEFLAELVERTVQAHVEGLWELGMEDTVLATEEIKAKMGELAAWAKVFVAPEPSNSSLVDDRNGEKVWLSVSKVIAIEEHVWSPQYGLKGNIDATIQSTLRDDPRKPCKQLVTPFEVKTGRTTQSPAHRAQTALYTLLLSDRYDVAVKAGILYYLESSTMTRIAPPVNEIRQMVQERNRLASYIHKARYPAKDGESEGTVNSQEYERSGLPVLLRNAFKCGRCYAQQSCFTYHALVEDGSAETAGMVDDNKKNHSLIWHEAVGHLLDSSSGDKTQAQALRAWFSKWDKLLTFEESESSRFRKELWTMASSEREESGRCFGNLVVAQDLTSTAAAVASSLVDGIEGSGGKINRYTYVLGHAQNKLGASFAENSQLHVGEPVVVSSEQGQWALANGYVIATSKQYITVAVDRKLGDARQRLDNFDTEHNQAFMGVMDTNKKAKAAPISSSPPLYRLDKDEFSNGLALIRNKLVTLMSSHPIHTKLRNQIVFDEPPKFASSSSLPALQPSQLGQMNDDQQAAVSKVLAAQDYALILGMPGTGKTTTIAHVIRALLAEKKTILLTSFTHTAVDNILLKIRDIAPEGSILRLGVPAKISPEVQTFCQLAATPRHSIGEIDETYMGCQIVATTCMGTNHALFQRRAFDVCIVDEASQITLPTALGPLLHARKFVLVGDHFQLPPLVQNRAALEGGLDISLFKQLSERFPEAVATLGRQYRMCKEIMSLSNELIYSGKLKCGNDAVANRTLELPNPSGLSVFHQHRLGCDASGPNCFLNRLTDPQHKVVFANIDAVGPAALETLTSGKNITNTIEAALTAQTVSSLLARGVPGREIGVITLYRSQLALLRQLFKVAGISPQVEIDSADRFQGRDKECIILSMVRSNEAGIVGDLLKDWRRVNVALTRARSKLVVFGSKRTLKNNELLTKFMALVDRNKWSIDLPPAADEMHAFAYASQQAVAVAEAASAIKHAHSPSKRTPVSPQSPSNTRKRSGSTTRALQESRSAGNRNVAKKIDGGIRQPGKVISGSAGRPAMKMKQAKLRQQVALDIFEDLTGEDFDFDG
jgi:DNA replication ATP-dependent helicase Dna2